MNRDDFPDIFSVMKLEFLHVSYLGIVARDEHIDLRQNEACLPDASVIGGDAARRRRLGSSLSYLN